MRNCLLVTGLVFGLLASVAQAAECPKETIEFQYGDTSPEAMKKADQLAACLQQIASLNVSRQYVARTETDGRRLKGDKYTDSEGQSIRIPLAIVYMAEENIVSGPMYLFDAQQEAEAFKDADAVLLREGTPEYELALERLAPTKQIEVRWADFPKPAVVAAGK